MLNVDSVKIWACEPLEPGGGGGGCDGGEGVVMGGGGESLFRKWEYSLLKLVDYSTLLIIPVIQCLCYNRIYNDRFSVVV